MESMNTQPPPPPPPQQQQYVIVTDDENEQPVELPAEPDGTLLLSTLAAQFNGACGLRYLNAETNSNRGVRLVDGQLFPPDGVWGSRLFVCVFPKVKEESKRKAEDIEGPLAKNACPADRKCSDLIVLGLPFKSTEDDVQKYFSQYGELVLVQLKRDPINNHSKGFAFIRYSSFDSQIKAMSQRHFLDGRWCEVRIPNSKESSSSSSRKIFVGRCTENITTDDLRSVFSKYGEVTDVYMPQPFRGFAFVTFSDHVVAQSLLGEDIMVRETSVHVSSATPRYGGSDTSSARHQNQQQSMYMGNPRGGQYYPGGGGRFNNTPGGYHYQQQKFGGAVRQQMPPNVGMFSEAVITAAQSALAQQGWGSLVEAVMPPGKMDPNAYYQQQQQQPQ
jgi:hypothetical protein